MDQSLDDIIRKKIHKNSSRGKGGFKKFGGTGGITRSNHHNTLTRRPGNIPQRRVGPLSPPGIQMAITDARNRIIQKKRQNLTDARDKLCELAKQTDARQKLEKLRERRLGREGIARDIGFNGNFTKNALTGVRGRTGFSPAAVKLQRTINQPVYNHSQFPPKVPALMDRDMDVDLNDGHIPDGPLHLRRTVNNDQMRATLIRPSKLSQSSPYSWKAPQPRQPPSTSRGYIDLDYPMEERKRMKLPSPPPMMRPIQLSDDELMEPVRPVARSTRLPSGSTAGAKTRLETSRIQQHSSTSATGPSGYRIVVSNLQNTVTHEDIRELFEDVGPLLTSRLVRPGTAEVVYRQYKDAERAVENYHNRQLDGQPMKCLLVKPRSSTASSATTNVRSSVGPSSKLSGSGKSSVVPDISTIHKALFNRS